MKKKTLDYIDCQIWMFIKIGNLWHEFLVLNIFHNLLIIEEVQPKQILHESFHSYLKNSLIHVITNLPCLKIK